MLFMGWLNKIFGKKNDEFVIGARIIPPYHVVVCFTSIQETYPVSTVNEIKTRNKTKFQKCQYGNITCAYEKSTKKLFIQFFFTVNGEVYRVEFNQARIKNGSKFDNVVLNNSLFIRNYSWKYGQGNLVVTLRVFDPKDPRNSQVVPMEFSFVEDNVSRR
jgi:hypothetical protein